MLRSLLTFFLALAVVVVPSSAANMPAGQSSPTPHVWTNEDLDGLHAQGLISTFAPAAQGSPATAAQAPAGQSEQSAPYDHAKDPAWYADQAAKLRDDLDKKEIELEQSREALNSAASNQQTTGGMALDKSNVGITPESGIAMLESQVQEIASQLEALNDLAWRNDIPLGVLRS